MKDERLFEIGEKVMIPVSIVRREFDERGNVKYKLKDDKSGKIFDWNYSRHDIIPLEETAVAGKKTTVRKTTTKTTKSK